MTRAILFALLLLANSANAEEYYEADVKLAADAVKWISKAMVGGTAEFMRGPVEITSFRVMTDGEVIMTSGRRNAETRFNLKNIVAYSFFQLQCASNRKCVHTFKPNGDPLASFNLVTVQPKYDTDQLRFSLDIRALRDYFHNEKGKWWVEDREESAKIKSMIKGCFIHNGKEFCNRE